MAAVTDLQVDRERLCPGEKATVVATTIASPDENNIVTWRINGQVVLGLPQAPNTLEVFGGPPGNKVITASLDGSSRSLTVIRLEADAHVELEPDPLDIRYVITAEPRMQPPVVTARAVGIGGPISVLEWRVTVGFDNFSDCPPNGPHHLDTVVDLSPMGGGEQITINLENVIRGGGISFSVSGTVNGCAVSGFGGTRIDGTIRSRATYKLHFRMMPCAGSPAKKADSDNLTLHPMVEQVSAHSLVLAAKLGSCRFRIQPLTKFGIGG